MNNILYHCFDDEDGVSYKRVLLQKKKKNNKSNEPPPTTIPKSDKKITIHIILMIKNVYHLLIILVIHE